MGEKETNAGTGQSAADTGANLRPGDPIPDIDVSSGPTPEPQQGAIVKSKSNITNN